MVTQVSLPADWKCDWCGDPVLDFYDDCGLFVIAPVKEEGVCCQHCWLGPLGAEHRRRYGTGDR